MGLPRGPSAPTARGALHGTRSSAPGLTYIATANMGASTEETQSQPPRTSQLPFPMGGGH